MTKSILIIEDEDGLSSALGRRFARRGFKVSSTSEPDEALAVLRGNQADLVISDINLNRPLSGIDIFFTMKTENLLIPFIFFTGHAEGTKELESAVAMGADAVFSKPLDFQILLRKVCELLEVGEAECSVFNFKN